MGKKKVYKLQTKDIFNKFYFVCAESYAEAERIFESNFDKEFHPLMSITECEEELLELKKKDDEICDVDENNTETPNTPYDYVDLGLPSGLKWAKCNWGAYTEKEYGDYYMLGSTEPDTYNICDWAHAPFNNGSSSYDKTYFEAHKDEWFDSDGTLKPEYDAATVNMGKGWRMPTKDDFQELIDGTNNEWVTINGIDGYKFTNKNDKSKYIFIPASGYRVGSNVYAIGNLANVWSSSLNSVSLGDAWYLGFDSLGIEVGYYFPNFGQPIRGVYDVKKLK